ncbi:MAG: YtxH domain-containing protein [Elusimicrobiaceae bacterium]|nr:YtxH domain-containing protein [Elusimicrobiaceae bacterium]
MCDRCRAAGTGLAAFLLGAVVGAAAGLLLAPARGETTRKRLKRWANDTYEDNKEYMLEHAQELKEKAKEHFENAREKFNDGKEKVVKEFNRRKDEVTAKFKKEDDK